MRGWILYTRPQAELTADDHGVQRLLAASKAKGIELEVFCPDQFELLVGSAETKSILVDGKPQLLPDFLIGRMGVKTTYFALAVIRQLEHLGVYCCNPSKTIELARDKMHVHQLLAQSNLPTPRSMLVKFPIDIAVVKQHIGFPLVLKNVMGTEGTGIYLCESESKFNDLMELIYSHNTSANIILQEYVQSSHGKDLRVFVLGGRVIGCMQRIAQNGCFKANVSRGAHVEPFELTPDIEWLATETARLLDLHLTGIDLLFAKEGYQVCEANSSPGFKGLERVVGECVAEAILDYICIKLGAEPQGVVS